jgi:hypothetical protein
MTYQADGFHVDGKVIQYNEMFRNSSIAFRIIPGSLMSIGDTITISNNGEYTEVYTVDYQIGQQSETTNNPDGTSTTTSRTVDEVGSLLHLQQQINQNSKSVYIPHMHNDEHISNQDIITEFEETNLKGGDRISGKSK